MSLTKEQKDSIESVWAVFVSGWGPAKSDPGRAARKKLYVKSATKLALEYAAEQAGTASVKKKKASTSKAKRVGDDDEDGAPRSKKRVTIKDSGSSKKKKKSTGSKSKRSPRS